MHAIGIGPTLSLRLRRSRPGFAFAGGALPAGVTLTRASAGTRYGPTGALLSEAANVARFDFDPVTLRPRGLLIEPAATNALGYGDDLTQSVWSKSAVTADGIAIVREGASNLTHYLSQNASFAAGTPYVASMIAGEVAGSQKRYACLLLHQTAFGAHAIGCFDLATGDIVTSPGVGAGSIPLGGGTRLVWIGAVASVSASTVVQVRLSNSLTLSTAAYMGDGASALSFQGAQLETGLVPTARIATTTAPATRAADVLMLDWAGQGVANGPITVRYAFDDGSTQDVATIVAGGLATVPTTLSRPRLIGAMLA